MRFFRLVFSLCLISTLASPKQENPKKEDTTQTPGPTVRRITVKGDVMKKKLVHKVTPKYPSDAMHQRVSGTVVLRVLIGVDGSVKDMQYVRSLHSCASHNGRWTVCDSININRQLKMASPLQ